MFLSILVPLGYTPSPPHTLYIYPKKNWEYVSLKHWLVGRSGHIIQRHFLNSVYAQNMRCTIENHRLVGWLVSSSKNGVPYQKTLVGWLVRSYHSQKQRQNLNSGEDGVIRFISFRYLFKITGWLVGWCQAQKMGDTIENHRLVGWLVSSSKNGVPYRKTLVGWLVRSYHSQKQDGEI